MCLIKLLISLFNKAIQILSFILVLILLASCSNLSYLYNTENNAYRQEIYINPISEKYGMMLNYYLKQYFPNDNITKSKYIIKVSPIKINQTFQLPNIDGINTQGNITVYVTYKVIDNHNNVVFSNSEKMSDYFVLNYSSYNYNNQINKIIQQATKLIAQDIAIKIIGLMEKSKGNLQN